MENNINFKFKDIYTNIDEKLFRLLFKLCLDI